MPFTFECKTLNNAIKKITTEITSFINKIHSLEKLPVKSKEVIKCYKKLIKELKQQQQHLQKQLEQKLMEWQPELVTQTTL